jgi:hypothetical protein
MKTLSNKPRRVNNAAVLAGLAIATVLALGIRSTSVDASDDGPTVQPVEILADNDAGPPPTDGPDTHSPTLPLPPPRGDLAAR